MERKTRFELATFSLARRRATTAPLPLARASIQEATIMLPMPFAVGQGPRWAVYLESARENGAEGENRTPDTAIFSRVLYRLSYLGPQIKCTHAIPGGSTSPTTDQTRYTRRRVPRGRIELPLWQQGLLFRLSTPRHFLSVISNQKSSALVPQACNRHEAGNAAPTMCGSQGHA
jgi:hypothetical protein